MKTRNSFFLRMLLFPLMVLLFSDCATFAGFITGSTIDKNRLVKVKPEFEGPDQFLNEKTNAELNKCMNYRVKLYLNDATVVSGKFKGRFNEFYGSDTLVFFFVDDQKINADEVGYMKITGKRNAARNKGMIFGFLVDGAIVGGAILWYAIDTGGWW